MDPTNPRWDTSDVRYRRQKLFWTVVAGSAAAVAASTMIVVSCLGRGQARHEPADLTIVERPAAAPAAPSPGMTIVINPVTPVPVATAPAANDSTGGTDDRAGTTNVTSAPIPQRTVTTAPIAVMVAPPAVAVPAPVVRQANDTSSGLPQRPVAPAAGAPLTQNAPSLSPTIAPQNNSTQTAPSPTQGAGAFSTDSPPNTGSSFQSNPEAGAGAFPGPQ